MKLVIVESPSKSRKLAQFLGEGWQVEASRGHVRDLPQSTLGIEVNADFRPLYEVLPRQANIVRRLLKAISEAEEELNIYGLKEIFGGESNFYSFARLDGFREGDENGDQPVVSHSLGEFGRERMEGPINAIREKTNMTEGEFLISWILRRVL